MRCIIEQNIRNKFTERRIINIKLVGFDWDGSVGHSRWFAFNENGNKHWYVEKITDNEFIISDTSEDIWTYISPWNSEGFVEQDFSGCNLNGLDLSYTHFKRCKFDIGTLDYGIQTGTLFVDCTYHLPSDKDVLSVVIL